MQDLSKTFAVSAVNAASAPAEADFDPNKPPVASANLNESIHIKQSALLEIQERHEAGGGMDHSLMRIFGENKLKVRLHAVHACSSDNNVLGMLSGRARVPCNEWHSPSSIVCTYASM